MASPSEPAMAQAIFVLTGPTSGLGRALYDRLNASAAPVIALGRGIGRLGRFEREAVLIEADFADPAPDAWLTELETAARQLLAAHPGKSLIFISNAGTIAPIGPATSLDDRALESAMRVNFLAPYVLAKRLVRIAGEGACRLRIANVTTGAALRPIPGWLAYCASKAACRMAFDVLAGENPQIDLVHIDPGVIDTAMQAHIREQTLAQEDWPAAIAKLQTAERAAADVLAEALEGWP